MTAIVIDTSAIIAIMFEEPEKDRFVPTILAATQRMISTVNFQEAAMVAIGRRGNEASWEPLDALFSRFGLEIVPHDTALAFAARDAFRRFGKGRHPARLNFGDCAAYALAKSNDLPPLFKGDNFSKTDIVPALTD